MYVAISFKECILFRSYAAACKYVQAQPNRKDWKIRVVTESL